MNLEHIVILVIVFCLVAVVAAAVQAAPTQPAHDPYFSKVVIITPSSQFDVAKREWTFQYPPSYNAEAFYAWNNSDSIQAEPDWYATGTGVIAIKFVRMARGLLVLEFRSIKIGDAFLVVTVGEHQTWLHIVVVNDEPNA